MSAFTAFVVDDALPVRGAQTCGGRLKRAPGRAFGRPPRRDPAATTLSRVCRVWMFGGGGDPCPIAPAPATSCGCFARAGRPW